jgi:hypothetical protein
MTIICQIKDLRCYNIEVEDIIGHHIKNAKGKFQNNIYQN